MARQSGKRLCWQRIAAVPSCDLPLTPPNQPPSSRRIAAAAGAWLPWPRLAAPCEISRRSLLEFLFAPLRDPLKPVVRRSRNPVVGVGAITLARATGTRADPFSRTYRSARAFASSAAALSRLRLSRRVGSQFAMPGSIEEREIGQMAVWSLSTAKPGNGVEQLRDDNIDTYWQSDGPQPHLINIQFHKKSARQTATVVVPALSSHLCPAGS